MSSQPGVHNLTGQLVITVCVARNLASVRTFGKQDPYCSVQIGKQKQRTRSCVGGNINPTWNETFIFALDPTDKEQDFIRIKIKDCGKITDSSIGRADIKITELVKTIGQDGQKWIQLMHHEDYSKIVGQVQIGFRHQELAKNQSYQQLPMIQSSSTVNAAQPIVVPPMTPVNAPSPLNAQPVAQPVVPTQYNSQPIVPTQYISQPIIQSNQYSSQPIASVNAQPLVQNQYNSQQVVPLNNQSIVQSIIPVELYAQPIHQPSIINPAPVVSATPMVPTVSNYIPLDSPCYYHSNGSQVGQPTFWMDNTVTSNTMPIFNRTPSVVMPGDSCDFIY